MELTHIDEKGAKMVDVGAKDVTTRTARAKGAEEAAPTFHSSRALTFKAVKLSNTHSSLACLIY